MFSRNTEKLESFIGANSHFQGDVKTKGTLRIDGSLEGNVDADWLILGEKASLKGNVTARGVIAGGKIEGSILAREILEIKPKGVIIGDISTVKLTVIEGGSLQGHSTMQKEGSNVIELQPKERAREV
ncbi:MAG TPA: polymer-forming cytoskeletal protein [Thermodesulfovibrionales bacterium]|nr:polymer-forming cytoskeletal protein [Thermodesulfovibrionales bacterium]